MIWLAIILVATAAVNLSYLRIPRSRWTTYIKVNFGLAIIFQAMLLVIIVLELNNR